ncbi:hypothetical protein PFBG_00240 [Plasmodium falciparum 7G8]|uniref:Erythrocyte membrane protein 1 n=3 Tax=Plasmodium falciparum TaxID=5833 RepID=W7FJM7_PLAF8|nr:hypothetical protein PFBG_00240 [Plasmodium falciparum 7G8]
MARGRSSTNEIELSARDVLENIGREIKSKRKNYSIHSDKLKGNISSARFSDGLFRRWRTVNKGPPDSCSVDHLFHTNINNGTNEGRNPCDGRKKERFGEDEGFECGSRIRDYNKKDSGTACVPPRRRHICDKNLEFLNNENTENTDDLLGNVLVTAKYEGDCIVDHLPDNEKSNMCTIFARTFADIGDIVRGRDMFKSNNVDAVQEGLKVVFGKIYNRLTPHAKNDYTGDHPNYYKLREDWWTVNRDQVWRALTCVAGEGNTYFIQLDDSKRLFWDRKCGHSNEGALLTNLDYVPQFLRWFDEWAEEFCRKKKDKLEKVKDVCRNYANNLYCSFNGYDCTKIIWKEHNFSNDSKCTKCHNECLRYENWIKEQKLEFDKQRDKYESEINRYNSRQINSNDNFNNIYYKEFYDELRVNYGSIEKFLNLLNKGNKCKNIGHDEKTYFNKSDDKVTFSRSKYCQVCPYCGVECKNGRCEKKAETDDNCGEPYIYNIPKNVNPIGINILNSDDEHVDIVKRLSEFCRDSKNINEKNYQEWKCYYNGESDNKCQMQKVLENKVQTKITSFDFFFDLWIKNLLRDTINWKSELKNCINNTNKTNCNKTCNENCKCFEKWVKQKDDEWKKVKKVFENKNRTSQNYYNKLNNHFQGYFFQVTNEVNKDEAKWNQFTEELRNKIDSSKAKKGTNDSQDAIKVLLEHLKEDGKTCTANNPDSACNTPGTDACSLEPASKTEPPKKDTRTNPCGASGTTTSLEQICNNVKRYIRENNGKTQKGGGCNRKNKNGNYAVWKCDKLSNLVKEDGVCMPPRRQKLCIKYLKDLNGHKSTNDLRTAFIKCSALETYMSWLYYKGKNGDDAKQLNNGTIPPEFLRSMFYTFGDFKDLYFNTDISKKDQNMTKVKTNINNVLQKYQQNDDEKRKNWWNTNAPELWKGMLCGLSNHINIKEKVTVCKKLTETYSIDKVKFSDTNTTLCDFVSIPQFLRWMIEWSEHFCKKQSQEYNDLKEKCNTCGSSNGIVTTEDCKKKCMQCKQKCEAYKSFIENWKKQWTIQSNKYDKLYQKTQNGANDSTEEEKPVVQYLLQLRTNSGNSDANTYNSAGAYVKHQGYTGDCQQQMDFNSNTNKNNYAFETYPHNYKSQCTCEDSAKSACNIVKQILPKERDKATGGIDGCNPKIGNYPSWNCDRNKSNKENKGACVPPRRQKFCVSLLAKEGIFKTNEEDIRETFIKSAALETYFAWKRYKEDNREAQVELQNGTIPGHFKRQMYYTFADYRDIFFGTDITSHNYILDVSKNAKERLISENRKQKTSDPENDGSKLLENWWNTNAKDIWDGMICALSFDDGSKGFKKEVRQKLESTYSYENLTKNSADTSTTLEEFAQTPQFLRWFTEWSDEFCRERKKKEEKVGSACKNDYDGCENTKDNGNGNCANACNAYKKYITDKKKQYDKQNKKFDVEKRAHKDGYDRYSGKKASEYLEKECLNSSCSCMKNVTGISDYWEQPHTTYDDNSLQKKCSCPPPPCEIVDGILGNKSSKGYVEGCRKKYMTRGLEGWECNSGNEDGDVCIPPRRQKMYVGKLHTLGEMSPLGLRTAFIECAAVETFFSWHEFKKEKEREDKEKNEQDVQYKSSVLENLQKDLQSGKIPEEFKRQMFYTFGDYRDIFFGKDIGRDMDNVENKIKGVFAKSGAKNEERKQWWTKYEKDIWDGMVCALSYDTETKNKNEKLRKKLIDPKNSNKYDNVAFKGGFNENSTKLVDFVKRPPYFRWLEEWADEFCRKRIYKLKMIKDDCRGEHDGKYCDEDGFDCTQMVPNKESIFSDFHCQSCATSCNSYKQWIISKQKEFNKQKEKYEKKIKNIDTDNYDTQFYTTLNANKPTVSYFIETLREGSCSNNNTGDYKINFNDEYNTFKHGEYCAPCPVFGVKHERGDWKNAEEIKCKKNTFKTKEYIKYKTDPIKVDMLVSDNGEKGFVHALEDVCKTSGIFEGIRENKWSCGYVCDLDICDFESAKVNKVDQQNIQIRAVFKRWLENFLKDYNKIKEKISYCINNDEVSKCINGCKNKCDCVEQWIKLKNIEWKKIKKRYQKQYDFDDENMNTFVKGFLEILKPQTEVHEAIKPSKNLNDLQDSCASTASMTSEKPKSKENDVVECLLHKLQKKINDCKEKHDNGKGKVCSSESSIPKNNPEDTPVYDISPDFPPPFCNVPPNPCGDKDATNVVGVEEVAKEIQEQRHKDMLERSGKNGGESVKGEGKTDQTESVLKGDISKATFKSGTNPSELKKVCDITKEHTNYQKRGGYNYQGPCTGKGNGNDKRFVIGTTWTDEDGKVETIKVLLPPRRRHMCTSNLEYLLHLNDGPLLQGDPKTIIHSFLGDVLLASKFEGEYIKTNYKRLNGQNNNEDKCRAMKYSFADIGDIIRGRDLWEHGDQTKLQGHLQIIFGKIKENLDDTIKDKYASEYKPYTQLRKDWWEANRKQIWDAMKCKTTKPPVTTNCDTTTVTPIVDYIPQRLRWMTEWAEWYCKIQKKEYEELEKKCEECRSGICDKGCEECKSKCKEYQEKIKPWEVQWEKIKEKYDKLYKIVSTNSGSFAATTGYKDEKDVVAFLSKLHEKNKDNNTIYATAAGYIHQEADINDCKKQIRFCKNPNGELTTSGKDNDKEYAFREKPHDHDDKCDCTDKTAPPPKKPEVPPGPAPPPQAVQPPPQPKPAEDPAGGDVTSPDSPQPLAPDHPAESEEEEEEEEEEDDSSEEEEAEEAEDTGRGEESPQPAAPAAPAPLPPLPSDNTSDILKTTIPFGIALALTSIAFFFMKKKTHTPVDLLRVLDIHKGDYGIPTPKSSNRYIPYVSDTYKGKTYIYMEGDSDSGHYYEDTTDITSSESEYEEMDINDIYVPGSPKYKTLIEVVLEPSKTNGNIPHSAGEPLGDDMVPTTNTFTDEEWNELKHDFISQYIQSRLPMDVPQYDVSTELPMNIVGNVLDDGINEKPFITSIHDRDLYTGEEISYNIHMSTNSMDDPKYVSNNVYSGIDLINDTLSGNQHIDIYDELLKRKENELFGTNYKKNTSNNSVAKLTNSDPIMNQLDLFHKWLDRHRDMCEKWNNKDELLDKLNEEWNKDNDGGDIPNDNKTLNTDVSIEIDMDNPKPINQFSNMDINVDTPTMDNMEDDIYYDVNDDENPSVDDIPMDHNKVDVDVPKKVHIEMKILNNTSNGSLEQQFPISDVWNI